ncbi:class I adenylate-forming enzyme family protein [Prosthecomicrobium pneumaticum]|uniref:Acyl-CoA synthetase (AMP-forming)/AMP-acid ligase II n=1 Tax=Prosthecomicrobium pneumaticum TaxID=81895 RepID=A0A7W9CTY9_9HYPH|nr:class I adenylate-forming enzyme family protein [Prosthecomicrobium pneumaticum]MBB5751850.1 acyl-CoA synthetase (AMP-forming)/AMP-acid ligase II [Prosthecomicrobium pneumaticum]
MLMHQLLLRGAERRPDKLAFRWVDRDRAVSYAEAVAGMEAFAGALADAGIGPGDRVTVVAHNGLDYLLTLFAAWRLGAIAALVNVRFADELDYYFDDHRPKVIVYTHDLHDKVRAAAQKTPGVAALLCMDGPKDGALSLPEMVAARLPVPDDPWDEDAIAHLSYTSGTTGRPKGACLAHEPTVRAARCIAERLRIGADDVSFGPTALSSSYQLVGNLLPQLDRTASIHVMGRWTQATGWDAVDAAGATMLIANPPVLEELLTESGLRGRSPGRLRVAVSGGGPVPPTLKKGLRDTLGLPLAESYGQSELGGFVGLGAPEIEPDDGRLMRIGPPLPDKEVAVFDLEDRPLGPGAVGELVLRGGFMKGYWGRPEKTAEATRGGWLRTGDIGFIDRDGCVTLRGRRSELIPVAGVSWYPRDVEEALCGLAGIRQAALIGIADAALGRRPLAFVTLAEGAQADPATMRDAIAGTVAYDLAVLEIRITDSLPMTPTGKISKAQLAERVERGTN